MHICIVGAGVIGVTSAWQLLQAGHEVTLVEAMPEAATGASQGNGAQLSYSYVAPLAEPSVWRKWPDYLLNPDSPFMLRPQFDTAQWRWLARFLGACNSRRARQTTIDLLRIAFYSRAKLNEWRPGLGFDFQFRESGKLVMLGDAAMEKAARAQVAFQAAYGSEQEVLDLDGCVAIEPALKSSRRQWVGGVYTRGEEVGDCAMFTRGLLDDMLQRRNFRFLPSSPVTGMDIARGELRSLQAGTTGVRADAYVLAAGAASAELARRAGFTLPVYPLKGYSITVPIASDAGAPRVSVTDLPRKIVYARIGDRLRVAGRLEMVGMNRDVGRRALDELTRGVGEAFPACGDVSDPSRLQPWAGLRPATPTGLPIIGMSPVRKLFLNVGHGGLGWTLACGSAALLASAIEGVKPELDNDAFRYA